MASLVSSSTSPLNPSSTPSPQKQPKQAGKTTERKKNIPPLPLSDKLVLRSAPVSPVMYEHPAEAHSPFNADIEGDARSGDADSLRVHKLRQRHYADPPPVPSPNSQSLHYRLSAEDPSSRDPYPNRPSRESDTSASSESRLPAESVESSVATSASSLSGSNDNAECPEVSVDHYPEEDHEEEEDSSAESNPVQPFQYHHQQQSQQPQSNTGSPRKGQKAQQHPQQSQHPQNPLHSQLRSSSQPDLLDSALGISRRLTPSQQFLPTRRSSMPRPQSSYSVQSSDVGSRGRSPGLVPGPPHARTPSVSAARRSPDNRPASYAELLNTPYPQPAPAPLSLDNSDLRTVIGNNASLLSTQKTLEMYRQNVKKTNDVEIQYSFAVFLISTAREQGIDWSGRPPKSSSPAGREPAAAAVAAAAASSSLSSSSSASSSSSSQELVREAKQILQRLAGSGYPFAQYYLADGYASGLFNKGKDDYAQAFPLFVLAAKHGHAESGYRTALCYEFGAGSRKDPAKAVQFLRAAASKGHPGAMTRLGQACLSGDLGEKRYREGVKWLKLATEAADSMYNSAPYQLGCMYETGYGDDIFLDPAYAAELFTQAAELGHPDANFRMGDAYEHGRLNCPRDPALSVHFYTGAAERGHAAAMMGLCAWYMVGADPILEQDQEEAYEWARKSAELGFVKAQYAVGYFTEMGIGCRRDILEANLWYVKAADAGDERAKQRLATIRAAASGGVPIETAGPRGGGKIRKSEKDDGQCVVM